MAYFIIVGQLGPFGFKTHVANLFTHGKIRPGGSTPATPALAAGLFCCQYMFFFLILEIYFCCCVALNK